MSHKPPLSKNVWICEQLMLPAPGVGNLFSTNDCKLTKIKMTGVPVATWDKLQHFFVPVVWNKSPVLTIGDTNTKSVFPFAKQHAPWSVVFWFLFIQPTKSHTDAKKKMLEQTKNSSVKILVAKRQQHTTSDQVYTCSHLVVNKTKLKITTFLRLYVLPSRFTSGHTANTVILSLTRHHR